RRCQEHCSYISLLIQARPPPPATGRGTRHDGAGTRGRPPMTATPRWGITLPLRSLPVPEQRDIVAALPDLGYTDAWSSELNGADAFTPLALAAQWTDRLRLGTAIAG